jgi:DNA-binding transcriptional MerR regulator
VTHATAGLTIDELARETGMTVRNIRSHQSRGLLPAPELRARTGYYGEEHIARLRLIQRLQGVGYNLAAIKDLLGRFPGSAALLAPFESEAPEIVDAGELAERYGAPDAGLLERAQRLRLLVALGDGRYAVPSPTVLRAGDALVALGVPLENALDMVERVVQNADSLAEAIVEPLLDAPDRSQLERLAPLVEETVAAVLQQRIRLAVERELERRAG